MTKTDSGKPQFILLDGRAKYGEEGRAVCMDTAMNEAEAVESGKTIWADHDAIWQEVETGNLRWDLPPAWKRYSKNSCGKSFGHGHQCSLAFGHTGPCDMPESRLRR